MARRSKWSLEYRARNWMTDSKACWRRGWRGQAVGRRAAEAGIGVRVGDDLVVSVREALSESWISLFGDLGQ